MYACMHVSEYNIAAGCLHNNNLNLAIPAFNYLINMKISPRSEKCKQKEKKKREKNMQTF